MTRIDSFYVKPLTMMSNGRTAKKIHRKNEDMLSDLEMSVKLFIKEVLWTPTGHRMYQADAFHVLMRQLPMEDLLKLMGAMS